MKGKIVVACVLVALSLVAVLATEGSPLDSVDLGVDRVVQAPMVSASTTAAPTGWPVAVAVTLISGKTYLVAAQNEDANKAAEAVRSGGDTPSYRCDKPAAAARNAATGALDQFIAWQLPSSREGSSALPPRSGSGSPLEVPPSNELLSCTLTNVPAK